MPVADRLSIEISLRPILIQAAARSEGEHIPVPFVFMESGDEKIGMVAATVVMELAVVGFEIITPPGIGRRGDLVGIRWRSV